MQERCSEWLLCEKLSRATSSPAATSLFKMRGSREAGPIVQTILECRKLIRYAPPTILPSSRESVHRIFVSAQYAKVRFITSNQLSCERKPRLAQRETA